MMLRYMPWKGLALRQIIVPIERAASAMRLEQYCLHVALVLQGCPEP
ncbi:hypothetical protein [Nocardia tengchongensis]